MSRPGRPAPSPLSAAWRRRASAVVTAWVGLWLMAFSLGAATALPMPGGDTAAILVVCTGTGMVDLTGDGDHHGPGQAPPLCQLCLPLLHGGAGPAAPVTLAAPADSLVARLATMPAPAAPLPSRHRAARPRAPPQA